MKKLKEIILGQIRHVGTTAGGIGAGTGISTDNTTMTIISIVIGAVGHILSALDKAKK